MIVFPVAKINIGLRITSKRSDGYHNIDTIFYPVRLSDALEFVVSDEKAGKDTLEFSGIDTGCRSDDNLVIKAITKLRENYNIPFLRVHLHKEIPIGAGLGGGSADAACLLKSVSKHFKLNIDNQELKKIALSLGSDCPFFIDGIPSYARGRGEILKTVNRSLSGFYLVLINPGVKISTSEAYMNCHPMEPVSGLDELYMLPVSEWKEYIFNDFEEFAFRKYPVLAGIKARLYSADAIFSLMSGSGSSVYGIFSKKPELPEALKNFVIWEGIM